eukprot:TRINITY_DN217_c0_g1_i2.p1 TRINITY_DN217_c0_g1~~TRINITY_DN217_c0_g1_i2.p1  ORF type:complete len:1932 (+),score=482.56 TRINITY_DN217_c0_g1_i2:97-5892(+)
MGFLGGSVGVTVTAPPGQQQARQPGEPPEAQVKAFHRRLARACESRAVAYFIAHGLKRWVARSCFMVANPDAKRSEEGPEWAERRTRKYSAARSLQSLYKEQAQHETSKQHHRVKQAVHLWWLRMRHERSSDEDCFTLPRAEYMEMYNKLHDMLGGAETPDERATLQQSLDEDWLEETEFTGAMREQHFTNSVLRFVAAFTEDSSVRGYLDFIARCTAKCLPPARERRFQNAVMVSMVGARSLSPKPTPQLKDLGSKEASEESGDEEEGERPLPSPTARLVAAPSGVSMASFTRDMEADEQRREQQRRAEARRMLLRGLGFNRSGQESEHDSPTSPSPRGSRMASGRSGMFGRRRKQRSGRSGAGPGFRGDPEFTPGLTIEAPETPHGHQTSPRHLGGSILGSSLGGSTISSVASSPHLRGATAAKRSASPKGKAKKKGKRGRKGGESGSSRVTSPTSTGLSPARADLDMIRKHKEELLKRFGQEDYEKVVVPELVSHIITAAGAWLAAVGRRAAAKVAVGCAAIVLGSVAHLLPEEPELFSPLGMTAELPFDVAASSEAHAARRARRKGRRRSRSAGSPRRRRSGRDSVSSCGRRRSSSESAGRRVLSAPEAQLAPRKAPRREQGSPRERRAWRQFDAIGATSPPRSESGGSAGEEHEEEESGSLLPSMRPRERQATPEPSPLPQLLDFVPDRRRSTLSPFGLEGDEGDGDSPRARAPPPRPWAPERRETKGGERGWARARRKQSNQSWLFRMNDARRRILEEKVNELQRWVDRGGERSEELRERLRVLREGLEHTDALLAGITPASPPPGWEGDGTLGGAAEQGRIGQPPGPPSNGHPDALKALGDFEFGSEFWDDDWLAQFLGRGEASSVGDEEHEEEEEGEEYEEEGEYAEEEPERATPAESLLPPAAEGGAPRAGRRPRPGAKRQQGRGKRSSGGPRQRAASRKAPQRPPPPRRASKAVAGRGRARGGSRAARRQRTPSKAKAKPGATAAPCSTFTAPERDITPLVGALPRRSLSMRVRKSTAGDADADEGAGTGDDDDDVFRVGARLEGGSMRVTPALPGRGSLRVSHGALEAAAGERCESEGSDEDDAAATTLRRPSDGTLHRLINRSRGLAQIASVPEWQKRDLPAQNPLSPTVTTDLGTSPISRGLGRSDSALGFFTRLDKDPGISNLLKVLGGTDFSPESTESPSLSPPRRQGSRRFTASGGNDGDGGKWGLARRKVLAPIRVAIGFAEAALGATSPTAATPRRHARLVAMATREGRGRSFLDVRSYYSPSASPAGSPYQSPCASPSGRADLQVPSSAPAALSPFSTAPASPSGRGVPASVLSQALPDAADGAGVQRGSLAGWAAGGQRGSMQAAAEAALQEAARPQPAHMPQFRGRRLSVARAQPISGRQGDFIDLGLPPRRHRHRGRSRSRSRSRSVSPATRMSKVLMDAAEPPLPGALVGVCGLGWDNTEAEPALVRGIGGDGLFEVTLSDGAVLTVPPERLRPCREMPGWAPLGCRLAQFDPFSSADEFLRQQEERRRRKRRRRSLAAKHPVVLSGWQTAPLRAATHRTAHLIARETGAISLQGVSLGLTRPPPSRSAARTAPAAGEPGARQSPRNSSAPAGLAVGEGPPRRQTLPGMCVTVPADTGGGLAPLLGAPVRLPTPQRLPTPIQGRRSTLSPTSPSSRSRSRSASPPCSREAARGATPSTLHVQGQGQAPGRVTIADELSNAVALDPQATAPSAWGATPPPSARARRVTRLALPRRQRDAQHALADWSARQVESWLLMQGVGYGVARAFRKARVTGLALLAGREETFAFLRALPISRRRAQQLMRAALRLLRITGVGVPSPRSPGPSPRAQQPPSRPRPTAAAAAARAAAAPPVASSLPLLPRDRNRRRSVSVPAPPPPAPPAAPALPTAHTKGGARKSLRPPPLPVHLG